MSDVPRFLLAQTFNTLQDLSLFRERFIHHATCGHPFSGVRKLPRPDVGHWLRMGGTEQAVNHVHRLCAQGHVVHGAYIGPAYRLVSKTVQCSTDFMLE